MKIQYALMSCNATQRYTEYWPIVAAAWLELGITPVCLFIPDNPTRQLPEASGGIVHIIPPLSDIHISIQTLTLRFWASYLYPEDTVIVSDIDLIPLSHHFFGAQLAAYPDHAYIYLNHAPDKNPFYIVSNIPEETTHICGLRFVHGCFHVARGEVMHKVLEFSPDWKASCQKTVSYYLHEEANIISSGEPYGGKIPRCGDELYASIRLYHSSYRPIFYISYQSDQQYKGRVTSGNIRKRDIRIGEHYTFAHFPPLRYSECKTILDCLLKKKHLSKGLLYFELIDAARKLRNRRKGKKIKYRQEGFK